MSLMTSDKWQIQIMGSHGFSILFLYRVFHEFEFGVVEVQADCGSNVYNLLATDLTSRPSIRPSVSMTGKIIIKLKLIWPISDLLK